MISIHDLVGQCRPNVLRKGMRPPGVLLDVLPVSLIVAAGKAGTEPAKSHIGGMRQHAIPHDCGGRNDGALCISRAPTTPSRDGDQAAIRGIDRR